MQSLFAAEWRKLLGHTKAIIFLVWIYPGSALTFVLLIGILPGLLFESVRELAAAGSRSWAEDMQTVWVSINSFPGGTFLRMPFLAFIAMAFAGEYQWGTWKNVLPRQSRTAVIVTKFWVLTVLLMVSLLLTSLIVTAGGWLTAVLFGASYGPALAEVDLLVYLQDLGTQILATIVSTLIMAAYAALIAMYSRSIMGSLLLTLGIAILEFTFSLLVVVVGQALDRPNLSNLIAATPTYSLENIRSWVIDGAASDYGGLPGLTVAPSPGASALVLFLWLGVLLGATAVIFRRQDITT